MYNYNSQDIHTQIITCVDEEELEGSGFAFQNITDIIIEFYKTRNISAGTYLVLPTNYKKSKSIPNIQMIVSSVFYCASLHNFKSYTNKKPVHQTNLNVCTHSTGKEYSFLRILKTFPNLRN